MDHVFLEDLRHSRVPERIACFFVADARGRLSGVVPVGRLLGADRVASVASIMIRNVVSLPPGATVATAADALMRHDLLALPIVDEGSRLLYAFAIEGGGVELVSGRIAVVLGTIARP